MQPLFDNMQVGGFAVVAYIVALVIIVFIHEMGHFLVGRWSGVNVEVFSIGFGPELWGFVDRRGTRWKLCAIPLGGYVKFEGDANAASLPDHSVAHKSTSLPGAALYKRALIYVAGPAANFLLAIGIFAFAYAFVGIEVLQPRVGEVVAGGAAETVGLKSGDLITAIDGTPVASFTDLQESMLLRGEEAALLNVNRAGTAMEFRITPKIVEFDDGLGGKVRMAQIGIRSDGKSTVQYASPSQAVVKGVQHTWGICGMTMRLLGKIIQGKQNFNLLHGPVGIAKAAGDSAQLGILRFVLFIGAISVSIGLINLFPIPMLDGGHLLFSLIEAVRGRPATQQIQEWGFRIGLSALLILMVVISTKDVYALFGQ